MLQDQVLILFLDHIANVTFPAGVESVQFSIPILDDNIVEGPEKFMLTIHPSSLPASVTVGDLGQATVTIMDDDRKHIAVIYHFLQTNTSFHSEICLISTRAN